MKKLIINGIVQGVGFRPFVYNTARKLDLRGYVCNSNAGVEIIISGAEKKIQHFIENIRHHAPAASNITGIKAFELEDVYYPDFFIKASENSEGSTLISPDLSVCEKCLQEMFDKDDKRYAHPFINCTNCGPRFSIIRDIPYDRKMTSMDRFEMCSYCESEYNDPQNRRFHAQPVACPQCGPKLRFLDKNLSPLAGDAIESTIKKLKAGYIVAIKGIGGFHLACAATNDAAVSNLRERKNRPHKPLAVMCSEQNIDKIVHVSDEERKLLKSIAAPIVILPLKDKSPISRLVAPQNPTLGVFIPYTPIHYQLLEDNDLYLIMTSGNVNGEPIATDEKELIGMADFFLTHNREILNRNDDSVIRSGSKQKVVLRRSRGYVPTPLRLSFPTIPTLATGAEMKIAFSISHEKQLYLSPYIGSSNSQKTADFFAETVSKYCRWFKIEPEIAACDLHPDFMTTKYAESLGLPLLRVQHHHAHIAAVMAEHHIDEPVLGIAYDGTGYGSDGAIWGGEVLSVEAGKFERLFHLNYMPLCGGDETIKHPDRIAFAYLYKTEADVDIQTSISKMEKNVLSGMLDNGNYHQTSSMGRLFDCISAMLGLHCSITFEAQAAMALEFLCHNLIPESSKSYPYEITDKEINILPMIRAIGREIENGVQRHKIAQNFHKTIISFTLDAAKKARQKTGINKIVLSGGVMQNMLLLENLIATLAKNRFEVYTSATLPNNDGAISVGQAMIANYHFKEYNIGDNYVYSNPGKTD